MAQMLASAGKAATLACSRPAFRSIPVRLQAPRPQTARRQLIVQAGNDQIGSAYANALVDLAQETSSLEAIHADMDSLQSMLKDNPDVQGFLASPVVEPAKKKEMLASLSKEAGFNEYTINFLNLLVDSRRMDAIENIFAAFEVKYCRMTDTQVATLRSAVKLEQEQQFLIAKKLQELTGSKNIKLKPVIDENLIAGFVVEYGSSQIDLSVKGQLDRITSELEGATALA